MVFLVLELWKMYIYMKNMRGIPSAIGPKKKYIYILSQKQSYSNMVGTFFVSFLFSFHFLYNSYMDAY